MLYKIVGILFATALMAHAGESLSVRKAKEEVSASAPVTTAAPTNSATRSRSVASGKLMDLAPEWQKHSNTSDPSDDDFVAPWLSARSFRGQPAPEFVVEKWVTEKPATAGKFLLIDFWATWCGPCRKSIPGLNALQKKFGDQLAVIGVTDEPEKDVRKVVSSYFEYAIAIDTKQRMYAALEGTAIPHCILVDPAGIVRFEGSPRYLNEKMVKRLLDKYAKQASS